MPDLSNIKFPDYSVPSGGLISREHAISSPWGRLFPLINAQDIRDTYTAGIPLISFFPDPITGKRIVYTDAQIEKWIRQAVARVEAETQMLIAPTEMLENCSFDRTEYQSYGYVQLKCRPCTGLISLDITTADRTRVFNAPLTWVAVANLLRGQLNLLPGGVLAAPLAIAPSTTPFVMYLSSLGWIPQFWSVNYVAGFRDFLVPDFVNDLIGITAAIEILSQLGATYAWMTGGSLGIDGLSQSSSGPGPQVFQTRIGELKERQAKLTKKFRNLGGMAISVAAL